MRLVYKEHNGHNKPGTQVAIGDRVCIGLTHARHKVTYFAKPHKPSSSGKVTVVNASGQESEFYVSVIGAEWIEREDQKVLVNEKPREWQIVDESVHGGSIMVSNCEGSDGTTLEFTIKIIGNRKVVIECEDLHTGLPVGYQNDGINPSYNLPK